MPRAQTKHSARAVAATICFEVIDQGRSLERARDHQYQRHKVSANQRALIQEMIFGVCRWYAALDQIAGELLDKPIRRKDRLIHFILLIGLYQLQLLRAAEHAAVHETVAACKQVRKEWAGKLVNACLRRWLRNPITVQEAAKKSHPDWLVKKLENHYPEFATELFHQNNRRAPMCLRVNRLRGTRHEYLSKLGKRGIQANLDPYTDDGLVLVHPVAVQDLPNFIEGACSVQDSAAQLAGQILACEPGMSVLDACAAPGGKTAHLQELAQNRLQLDAFDISRERCQKLTETLARLDLKANVYQFDARRADQWPSTTRDYQRILIDAPCSGTGVIRRHPDIKHLRRLQDIEQLSRNQYQLLTALWLRLAPGGRLLYATCSVLPEENEHVIERFLSNTNDVILRRVDHPCAVSKKYGYQSLPGIHGMDGFYICLLEKPKRTQ